MASPAKTTRGRASLSFYYQGEDGAIPEGQVFRLEGPGAVLYFRGHPHVHAFINITRDPRAPLSSGAIVGQNPAWLGHAEVKALFEAAMQAETGADLAHYSEHSVAGRLRPGIIRSGDIYILENWQDRVAVLKLRGASLGSLLRAHRDPPVAIDSAKLYTVSMPAHMARELEREGVRGESRAPGPMLRDLVVSYLTKSSWKAGAG